MARLFALAALLVSVACGQAAAQFGEPPRSLNSKFREHLDIGISTNEIAIAPDFRGVDITVFGAVDGVDEFLLAIGAYDIIVALEGPKRQAIVRRKERVAGIWVNRHSILFEPIPASYSISSTRTLDSITKPMELATRDTGIDNIRLVPTGAVGDGSRLSEFREAFRRIKQTTGLYQRDPSGVQFVSKSLFKASVRLPANIPIGQHTVRAELYRNGQFIMEAKVPLRVVKTGLEQFTYDLAHQHALLYGCLSVLFAVVTGWLGSLLFRRD
jgi:conserved hypothetical protein